MNGSSADATAPGVYYRPEDYVGVFRRLVIDAIDIPVVILLCIAVIGPVWSVLPLGRFGFLLLWCSVWFGYFVLLKRSRFRTLGYVIARARIVSLTGQTPGIPSLVGRLVFAVAGPLNVVMDILWMTGDRDRQAIRDKFAGTYVVERDAQPAGTGPIVTRTLMFAGMTLIVREVQRTAAADATRSGPKS